MLLSLEHEHRYILQLYTKTLELEIRNSRILECCCILRSRCLHSFFGMKTKRAYSTIICQNPRSWNPKLNKTCTAAMLRSTIYHSWVQGSTMSGYVPRNSRSEGPNQEDQAHIAQPDKIRWRTTAYAVGITLVLTVSFLLLFSSFLSLYLLVILIAQVRGSTYHAFRCLHPPTACAFI